MDPKKEEMSYMNMDILQSDMDRLKTILIELNLSKKVPQVFLIAQV